MKAILKEQLPIQEFFNDGRNLTVRWQNGHKSRFDSMWLRDNCPEDRDPQNGQRYVDIPDLPPDPRIGAVKHIENGVLAIVWAGEAKHSWFDSQWLWNHSVFQKSDPRNEPAPVIWTGNEASKLLWSDYSEVASSDKARWQWLNAIAEYGIAFLQNVPCKDQQVQEVASLAGFIHETNCG